MLPEGEYLGLRAAEAFLAGTVAAVDMDEIHPANLPSAVHAIKALVEPATDRDCYRLAYEQLVCLLDDYGDVPDKDLTRQHAWDIAERLRRALRDFRSDKLGRALHDFRSLRP